MLYLDLAILNLTEWACRRFQRLTGRTNVWLAVQLTNLSIIVYFVWAVAAFWNGGIGTRIFVGLFCSVVLYALTQTVFKVPIEMLEGNAYRRVAKGLRNPRRVRDALLRVSFLTLSLLLCFPVLFVYVSLHISVLLLSYSLIALTTGVLYLLACDPLPPCAGKIREWLGRLAWQSATAAEGVRQFESEPAKGFAPALRLRSGHPERSRGVVIPRIPGWLAVSFRPAPRA
jgi:hypothetical protein